MWYDTRVKGNFSKWDGLTEYFNWADFLKDSNWILKWNPWCSVNFKEKCLRIWRVNLTGSSPFKKGLLSPTQKSKDSKLSRNISRTWKCHFFSRLNRKWGGKLKHEPLKYFAYSRMLSWCNIAVKWLLGATSGTWIIAWKRQDQRGILMILF